MKNKYLLIIPLVLVIVAAIFASLLSEKCDIVFSAGNESICVWQDADVSYVFVPSYAHLSDLRLKSHPLYINDVYYTPESDFGGLKTGEKYEYSIKTLTDYRTGFIVFEKSENVASIFIKTESGVTERLETDRENKENASIFVYDADGTPDAHGKIKIRGRGNSTWSADKKPYNIYFEKSTSVLGMKSAKNWALLANAYDHSNVRNKAVYDFSASLPLEYSPHCEYADVYFNGVYGGLYLISEKAEEDNNRLELTDGDYLIKLDDEIRLTEKDVYFTLDSGMNCVVEYPERPDGKRLAFISNVFQRFENSALSDGWEEYIDIDSWAYRYLVDELFMNVDSLYLSTYFYYKHETGKIYAGPVWDFDYSLGSLIQTAEPHSLLANREYAKAYRCTPWYYELLKKDKFRARVSQIYESEIYQLAKHYAEEYIPEIADKIKSAAALNSVRRKAFYNEDAFPKDLNPAETASMLSERADFLKSMLVDNEPYHQVRVQIIDADQYLILCVPTGGHFNEEQKEILNNLAQRGKLAFEITDEPFDIDMTVNDDIRIKIMY